jgi:hypothetical protein
MKGNRHTTEEGIHILRKAEGGRRKAEGGRRKAEGGRRKAEEAFLMSAEVTISAKSNALPQQVGT